MRVTSITATLIIERVIAVAYRETRESKTQILRQEARYRSLVENMGDVLMEYDGRTQCFYASSNCFDVIGRHADELLGARTCLFLISWGRVAGL
jgi:PAS domain-containing protein